MPPIIVSQAHCEVRAVIRFLSAKGLKSIDIHHEICAVYGQSIMSDGMVKKWVRAFIEGRTNVHDEQRSGRPSVVNESYVHIVSEHLNYRKLCSRWVPKMLTDVHKTKRLGSALTFLERYHDGDFLSQIVMGHETWVAYVTPESKQQSMKWRNSDSPRKLKFKQTTSARKVMCTVFWDRKGVLLLEFPPRNETICAVQSRTKDVTKDLITSFQWETLDHPPYSPDLASSDYHLFLHLSGQRLQDDDEVKTVVMQWLRNQAADFYEEGIQKLLQRYDKCLNVEGNYVEK
ncbi:histone-lysine N-methyltransferase SETMAR-like [Parasteatoda tepidariorum]|uniref:histone-lysine N-methyltransferase SETMAR-like n=1 Tax=Parasteatoda tepidariorum TaxID=114398 RepID=UPI0039BD739C